jgi:hypothetical protein
MQFPVAPLAIRQSGQQPKHIVSSFWLLLFVTNPHHSISSETSPTVNLRKRYATGLVVITVIVASILFSHASQNHTRRKENRYNRVQHNAGSIGNCSSSFNGSRRHFLYFFLGDHEAIESVAPARAISVTLRC